MRFDLGDVRVKDVPDCIQCIQPPRIQPRPSHRPPPRSPPGSSGEGPSPELHRNPSSNSTSAMSINKLLSTGHRASDPAPYHSRRSNTHMDVDDEREELMRYMDQRRAAYQDSGRPIKVARPE